MTDPLAEIVALLEPSASFSKVVNGRGPWRVRRSEDGVPFYCLILEGACRLDVSEHVPVTLEKGDFVLVPAAYDFTTSSLDPMPPAGLENMPVSIASGEYRLGGEDGAANVRMLVGYCAFGSPDAALLVSLLPRLVHIRGERRLTTLAQLVDDEWRQARAARSIVLARLVEVLLIEALRCVEGPSTSPGLVRGLGDERVAIALRRMHERPARGWTVVQLAKEASLSRSVFFERFRRAVGIAPMEYLLAWRMALAKDMLRRRDGSIAEVAQRVGYSSASTFSVAFSRHAGLPPAAFTRRQ